jgi:histone deacetylase 11
MDSFLPEFVIYNAGSDILMGDPLGGMSISVEGFIARDETIFKMCINRNIPLVMVLSGGYQKINAEIIALSI